MHAHALIEFIEGRLSAPKFQLQTSKEVSRWIELLSEKGRAAPVYLSVPTENFCLKKSHLRRLIGLVIKHKLPSTLFAYVLEALLMSEKVDWESEELRDTIERLSDSESPGTVKFDQLKVIYNELLVR